MEENRYQVLAWIFAQGWKDVLGQSLTVDELAIALPDLLSNYDNIRIDKV